jgi:hypothetical protein
MNYSDSEIIDTNCTQDGTGTGTTGSYPVSDRSKRPGPIMVHERDELNFIEW